MTAARVLVADDDACVRETIAVALRTEGLEVTTARDGSAALVEALVDPPDLVLLDATMPSLDGWSVAARLAAEPRTAHVPLVLLVDRTADADLARHRALGCAGWLSKPFDLADLCDLVHTLLDGRAGVGGGAEAAEAAGAAAAA